MTEPSIAPDDDASEEPITPSGIDPTGHDRVDEALERLAGLDEVEIVGHPEQFDAIHRVLRESLANAGRDEDAADSA